MKVKPYQGQRANHRVGAQRCPIQFETTALRCFAHKFVLSGKLCGQLRVARRARHDRFRRGLAARELARQMAFVQD